MKRLVRILGIVVVLLLVIAVAIPFLIDANQFRPTLESRLTTALGREVKMGNLKVSLFSGSVSASDLSIADDPAFSKTPFLRAQSLQVGVEMLPLILSRKLNVTGLTIDQPQINIVETPAGVFNFSSIGAKPGAASSPPSNVPASPSNAPASPNSPVPAAHDPDLTVALVKIANGRITVQTAGSKRKPLTVDQVNMELKNFAANAQFPFSLSAGLSGGGTINLDGTAGPIDAGNVADTPFNAKLTVAHLDLARSGLVDPKAGLAGLASVDGSAASANGTVNVTGKLKVEEIVLAKGGSPGKRPIEIDLAVSHSLAKQSGQVERMTIHLGKATANLSGTYRFDTDPVTVNLKLVGSKMPLTELAAFLPPLNIALPSGASIDQGTADFNLSSEGPLDTLVTRGTVSGQNVRLANYDLASKLSVLHELTGIKAQPHTLIQTLSTNVTNTTAGTALDKVQLVIPSIGTIAGAGTISPSHALNFKMRATLAGGMFASVGGKSGIPFTIQGTAENPSINPDVKGIVSGEIKDLGKSPSDAAKDLLKGILGGNKK